MAYVLNFNIDMLTESQNPWERMHWTERQRIKDSWFWLVKGAIGIGKAQKEPKVVHIVRVAQRLIDDQNVPAGCKYLVDALQTFGHIYRDSRRWARVTFDQRKCRKDEEPHMEVTVTDPSPQELPSFL